MKLFFYKGKCVPFFGSLFFSLSIFTILNSCENCAGARKPQRYTKGTTFSSEENSEKENIDEKSNSSKTDIEDLFKQGVESMDNSRSNSSSDHRANANKFTGSVVLYHGLNHEPKSMENLKKELEELGAKVYISTAREGKTSSLDIQAQFSVVEEELKNKLESDSAFLQNARKNGLYEIGYSQGGFSAGFIAKNKELHSQFKITKNGAVFLNSPAGGGFDGNYKALAQLKKIASMLSNELKLKIPLFAAVDFSRFINTALREEILPFKSSYPGVFGMSKTEVAKNKYSDMGDVNTLVISSTCEWNEFIASLNFGMPVSPIFILDVLNGISEKTRNEFKVALKDVIDGEDNDGVVPISSQEGFTGSKIFKHRFNGISHLAILNPENSKKVASEIAKRFDK